jgi:Xaa-Pro dipeptidase
MALTRRAVLKASGVVAIGSVAVAAAPAEELPPSIAALEPMTAGIEPIGLEEHRARIGRAQRLLAESGLDALVVGPSTSLSYFTGVRWDISERFLGMVLTREGDPAWVTPAFEKARAQEQIRIGSDVRAWEEHESPYALVAGILEERKAAAGSVGLEETLPYAFVDGIAKAAPAARLSSGTPVTAGCRMIKDAHEVALMKRACDITLRAHRAVFASLKEGMTQGQVSRLSQEAHARLGMDGGALVLFGPDAAFPHGTAHPRPLKAGDVVLIDGGGRLHGYASDITRSGVFGARPTDRQRRVWDVVRRAQDAAFKAARPGVECQAVDAAARAVVEQAGFGSDYRALTHRLGHGIGMDGHEWTYFVRGNTTPIRAGMCFTDEPGIYIPGEMGIRHEDVLVIREAGAENMTPWTGSPEDPAVV